MQVIGLTLLVSGFVFRVMSCVSLTVLNFTIIDLAASFAAAILLIGLGTAIKLYEFRERLFNDRNMVEIAVSRETKARQLTDKATKKGTGTV